MKVAPFLLISLLIMVSFQVPGSESMISVEIWNVYDLVFNETVKIEIGETVVWENVSVLCEESITNLGNLTLKNSIVDMNMSKMDNQGRLYLFNSTLKIKGSSIVNENGGFMTMLNSSLKCIGSTFTNSGSMYVTDLDADPTTNGDRSEIVYIQGGSSDSIQDLLMPISHHFWYSLNISCSYIEGFRLFGGNPNIANVRMKNSTIFSPTSESGIQSLEMIGSGSLDAITIDYPIRMDDITISGYGTGILITNSISKTYRGFNISDCDVGIDSDMDGLTLTGSTLSNNTIQIVSSGMLNLNKVEVEGGILELSTTGQTTIYKSVFRGIDALNGLSYGIVRESIFTDCDTALNEPNNSLITLNRFIGNSLAIWESMDCEIYHNSFKDNNKVVSGSPGSIWYNQTSMEGNHYDSYNGLDDGSNGRRANDGIGDTEIPYLGRDPYPLIQDRYWEMPRIPVLKSAYEAGSDRIDLWWDDVGKSYIVQRSTSEDFSSKLVSWSLKDTTLSVEDNDNTTLFFRVLAFNEVGSRGWSIPIYVYVDQRPLPPNNFRVEPVPEGKAMAISWDWVGEDQYRALIYYSHGLSEYNPIVVYYPDTSAIVRSLQNEQNYSFFMITLDRSGSSSVRSVTRHGIPKDIVPPPPPRNLLARVKSNQSIALEWDPPLTQDIWGYIIYRRDPGIQEFDEVTRLSKSVLYFEDRELADNTTYEYAMASVDDDGPLSILSEPVSITTAHNNQRPIFTGSELILYLVEDEGPLQSDILDDFSDPNGDELVFGIAEYFPFKSTITNGQLWIIPEKDQAGEGYVQISVSDGEDVSFYLIGIIVEPVEDPPRDISIISPVNGSVLLPGALVTLEASGYDPDVDNGDILNVTWTSDIDGLLHLSTQSIMRAVRELSPGRHRIELKVEDRSGNVVYDSVTVIVSLWGWGEMPWRAVFTENVRKIDPGSPYLELTMENDSPLVLRFSIRGSVGGTGLTGERNILIGPRSNGRITLELLPNLSIGDHLLVVLEIDAQTLNGTYGGSFELSDLFEIASQSGENPSDNEAVITIITFSILALIGLGIYLAYTFWFKANRKGD